jgi:hypothetical protein
VRTDPLTPRQHRAYAARVGTLAVPSALGLWLLAADLTGNGWLVSAWALSTLVAAAVWAATADALRPPRKPLVTGPQKDLEDRG